MIMKVQMDTYLACCKFILTVLKTAKESYREDKLDNAI